VGDWFIIEMRRCRAMGYFIRTYKNKGGRLVYTLNLKSVENNNYKGGFLNVY